MSEAEAWLRDRLGDVPPELLHAMLGALPSCALPLPRALGEGALRLLAGLSGGGALRSDALPLLAADALLTHAFQAQAELDPDGIGPLASRLGPAGEIGALAVGTSLP